MLEQPRTAERGWYTDSIHDTPVSEGAETPDFETFTTGEAALRGGDIAVTATDSGLPAAVHVTPDQLRRNPEDLADDILRLCRLAADRAGLRRREYLAGLGLDEDTLNLLGLPTKQALEQSELADETEHDYEPRSWLDQGGNTW